MDTRKNKGEIKKRHNILYICELRIMMRNAYLYISYMDRPLEAF